MAGSIIGALRATLGLDVAGFETGAKKAAKVSQGLKGDLLSVAGAFNPVIAGATLATSAVGMMTLGLQKAGEAAKYADDLAAAANRIGETAESLQVLRQAGEMVDIPIEKMDGGLERLNGTLGALRMHIGDGKIRKAFDELGIPQETLNRMGRASDLLPLLADKISQLGTQADQVLIAKKLGIEDLLPLLQKGAAGIQELREKIDGLNIVLSESTVQHLADMSEQMRIADERAKVAGMNLGAVFTPALVAMKNATADAYDWMGKLIDRFNSIQNKASATLRGDRQGAWTKKLNLQAELESGGGRDPRWLRQQIFLLDSRIKEIDEELVTRFDAMVASRGAQAPAAAPVLRGSAGTGKARKAGDGITSLPSPMKAGKLVDPDSLYELADLSAFEDGMREAAANGVGAGVSEAMERSREETREGYRWAIAGGLEAAVRGGGKGLMEYLADQFKYRLIDNLASGLAQIFEQYAFNGGGGLLGSLMGTGRGLFGFATGGSARVAGVGGVDSKIVSFRATPGELIDVRRPGQAGGGQPLQALVVHVDKSDLFDVHVQRAATPLAMQAGAYGEQAGAARAERNMMRRAKQRLGGG